MKIRLVLAITFILFSITSGIEVFGMKENDTYDFNLFNENNIENDVHGKKELNEYNYPSSSININTKDVKDEDNINSYNNNYSNINNNVNKINNYDYCPAPPLINSELINNNISNHINSNIYNPKEYVPQEENSPKLIRITQPFGLDKAKNILFFYFFKKVECIYEGTLGITLFEILASFGMSILNNIVEFEKMDKNKFYANMFLFKFGFKLGIPILSFIIVDFNICIYNWLASGIKYLMVRYNKAPLEQLGIKQWKAKSFDKNFKFICLFNAFNIDIKLNIFGLSLCIPLTKILEALLICKLIQEVGYKKKIYTSRKEMGEIYNAIYDAVETKTRKAKGIMNRITEASEEGLKILEEISTQAREILPFPKKVNNNNPNNNNIVINNIHNNNIINVNNNHEDNNNIAAEENIIINNNLEENNIDEDNNINNEENNNIPEDNNIDEEDNNNNEENININNNLEENNNIDEDNNINNEYFK